MAHRPYVGLGNAIEARALEALLEIAGAVGEALDPVRIAQLAVNRAAPLLQADAAYVWMWDEQAEVLRIVARHDPGATASAKQDSRLGESIVGQVFVQRQPVVVDDYQSWEFARRTMASSGAKSAMGVPLLVNDRPIGTLIVHNYQQRPFDGRQVELLSLFAAQVAPALEMARLYVEADRRRAEAEAISISLAEGVCATNARGIITFANPAAQKLLGLEERELLGQDLHGVVHRHTSDGEPCLLGEVLSEGAAAHVEDDDFYRANGSMLSVALSASAIIEGDAVTGLVLAFRDITARKELEVRLQRFNTELEQRVLERTEELEAANREL
ncbi:MAG: GAF domain-containing protein, partial [Chloroflexota bacterium]